MSLGYDLAAVDSLDAPGYDGILLVAHSHTHEDIPEKLRNVLAEAASLDSNIEEEIGIYKVNLNAKRLIYAPTGNLSKDYHDVRSFADAARKGIARAVKAGLKAPLVVLVSHPWFKKTQLVTLLGVLEGLYVNLQYREDVPNKFPKVNSVGVYSSKRENLNEIVNLAKQLEIARLVARDIGGSDPERMTPANVEKYVKKIFAGDSAIKMEVVSDEGILVRDYPLFAAVNRAASVIDRHKGRIIYLTYEGSGEVKETLLLVGKGVTYDTGGADIKAGGIMAGMSRDKCGAAAVAGFMKLVSALKPANLKVVGALSMVRNSVGENSYVSDEVITARSGRRVRVGNTDAEGRMIMADVLCYMKELAEKCVNPHLFTVATLTGHAARTVGPGYTITMDNAPARKENFSQLLQSSGDDIGDMFEVSMIRREDFETHKGKVEGEDIVQALNLPSAQSKRGHQGPAAFLILAAGLDKHGLDADEKEHLKYTHLDIAGSAGAVPDLPTASPLLGLASQYLHL